MISSTGSPAAIARRRSARACSSTAERGRSPCPGWVDGGHRETAPPRQVQGSDHQPELPLVQAAVVAGQDQRGRCGFGRPQDTGNRAEGEFALEDAVVEALFGRELRGRRRPGDVPPGLRATIDRHAPHAVVLDDFHHRLLTRSKRTPFPAAEIRRALAGTSAAGV